MGHARLLFTGVLPTSAAAGRVLWPLSPVNLTPRKHGAGRGRGRGRGALSQAYLFPSFARHPVWKNTVFQRSVSLGSWGQTSEPRGGCTGGRGRLASDRLLRDARSVSRFRRCPCPRRLGEGFGAPGLALKRCRPPGKSHRWGRQLRPGRSRRQAAVSLRARRPHGDTPSCHVVGGVGVLCGLDSVSLRSRWDFPADIYPPPKPPAPRPQPGHSDHGGGKAAARWVGALPGWVPSRSPLLVPGC